MSLNMIDSSILRLGHSEFKPVTGVLRDRSPFRYYGLSLRNEG